MDGDTTMKSSPPAPRYDPHSYLFHPFLPSQESVLACKASTHRMYCMKVTIAIYLSTI